MSTVAHNSVVGAFLLNNSRIPGSLLDLFLRDFQYFNDSGQRLDYAHGGSGEFGARLLRYVVDGEGSVLDDVKVRPGWSIASGDNDAKARETRWRIYDRWGELPPQALIRFARLLAASSSVVLGCPRLDLSKTAPWVEALTRDLIGLPVSHEVFWRKEGFAPHPKASVARLGALMEEDGLTIDALILSAFTSVAGRAPDGCDFLGALAGFGAALARMHKTLAPLFHDERESVKLRALSLLGTASPGERAAFAQELIALATDESPQVREAALAMVNVLGAPAKIVIKGLQGAAAQTPQPAPLQFTVPEIDLNARTSAEARNFLSDWLAETNADVLAVDAAARARGRKREPLSSGLLMRLAHEVESAETSSLPKDDEDFDAFNASLWTREMKSGWDKAIRWMAAPGVQSIHIVRLLTFTGQLRSRNPEGWALSYAAERIVRAAVVKCHQGSLLEFARAFEALGAPVSLFVRTWYGERGAPFTSGWPDQAVWPFFASYPEALDAGLDDASPYAKAPGFDRLRLFDALETFPELPPDAASRLAGLACEPHEQVRAAAFRLMQKKGLALPAPAQRRSEREDLAKAAAVELKKRTPAGLAWFPFAALPTVRWAEDGEAASPEVIQWFVIQSHRLKTPQADALLHQRCALFRAPDAEALGAFTLGAWMARDLQPAGCPSASKGALSRSSLAGGLPSKGLLALAAACGGGHVAAMAQQYLNEWASQRAGQAMALMQMLAETRHRAAEELLLSAAAGRYPVEGVQEEAVRQAQRLAGRKGWTPAELGDRTLPFAPAENELKSVLRRLKDRLYEAMCAGRVWRFEDCASYLFQHPVAGPYCQRLVWGVVEEDAVTTTFRPLSDGALTDAAGKRVALDSGAMVILAHDVNYDAAAGRAWLDHFRDHDLWPLFTQFGRGALILAEALSEDVSLDDCEGTMIPVLALRGAAEAMGYAGGPGVGDGWFFSYVKPFATLGLEAAISFTGDHCAERGQELDKDKELDKELSRAGEAALLSLSLNRIGAGRAASPQPVPLGELPTALLSECWNDLRQMASAGRTPGLNHSPSERE